MNFNNVQKKRLETPVWTFKLTRYYFCIDRFHIVSHTHPQYIHFGLFGEKRPHIRHSVLRISDTGSHKRPVHFRIICSRSGTKPRKTCEKTDIKSLRRSAKQAQKVNQAQLSSCVNKPECCILNLYDSISENYFFNIKLS